jgi:flagellar biosynthesis/type III secretory pathway protein FliH
MVHEITVAFSRPLRQVVRIASDAPPAPAASSLLRREEEDRRRQQQEQQATNEERRQIAAALAGLATAATSLRQDVDRMRGEMEAAAVELATALASRLIHKAIDADAFGVQELVHELTARLEGDRAVTVFLHPEDLKLLQRRAPESGGDRAIQLKADAALGRGDCRAVSGDVSLISQLRVQMADLNDHLRRSVTHESEDA